MRALTALSWFSMLHSAGAEFNPVPYVSSSSLGSPFQYVGDFHPADLDADGRTDHVTYYQGQGVFWQRSLDVDDLAQAPLADPQKLSTATLDFLRIADLDGDGYPDLLGSRRNYPSNDQIYWLRNTCGDTGIVAFETIPRLISEYSGNVVKLFAEDLDGDGDLDVISTSNFSSEEFSVHENQLDEAASTFADPVVMFPQRGRYLTNEAVIFRDFDSDGDLDLATTLTGPGLPPGKETIAWMENTLTDVAGYGLELDVALSNPGELPDSTDSSALVIALIGDELWFRFLPQGQVPVTYRETTLVGEGVDLATLRDHLEAYWDSPPDAFAASIVVREVARLTGFKTGDVVGFTAHQLYSGYLPGSTRYYSPDQFLGADMDGDGDIDLFTGYTGSYGPLTGWFENRLNEEPHANIGGFQEMKIEAYGGGARLSDVDGNGLPDLIYRGTDFSIRVLYDCRGLQGDVTSWTEVVRKHATGKFITQAIGNHTSLDLDGDGDEEILGDALSFFGTYSLVSENLAENDRHGPFDRHETELVTGLSQHTTTQFLRAKDADGDGDPDLAFRTDYSYRNDYTLPPTFDFVQDSTLGVFEEIPANSELLDSFDQWLEAQSWQRVAKVQRRLLADVDLDGDLDVVVMHGIFDYDADLSWFENRSGAEPDFRGPIGISGNIDLNAEVVCADYDSDGDSDVLALGFNVRDGIKYLRVIAFENQSRPKCLIQHLVEDSEGFYRNATTSPGFSATLFLSEDLDWSTAETRDIPPSDLRNPAAMKQHMNWLSPDYDRRFYRLLYSLD